MNISDAMKIAQAGFDAWKDKPHNARWFAKIDHTPIPNDLVVNIAEAFASSSSPAGRRPGRFEVAAIIDPHHFRQIKGTWTVTSQIARRVALEKADAILALFPAE